MSNLRKTKLGFPRIPLKNEHEPHEPHEPHEQREEHESHEKHENYENHENHEKLEEQKNLRAIGAFITVPFVLAIPPVLGWFFGSWLDGKLGTRPFLMYGFV